MAHFAKYRFPSIYDFTRRNAAFLSAFVSLACFVPASVQADVIVNGNAITGSGTYSEAINTADNITVTPDSGGTVTFNNSITTTGTFTQSGGNVVFENGSGNTYSFSKFEGFNANANTTLNGSMTVGSFMVAKNGKAAVTINDGASLVFTGLLSVNNVNNSSTQGVVYQNGGSVSCTTVEGTSNFGIVKIGHWNTGAGSPGIYNLSGGTFSVPNAMTYLGWDGHGQLNISGGEATLMGISMSNNSSAKGYLSLTGGTLNLGSGGLQYCGRVAYQPSAKKGGVPEVKLGQGTINAYETQTWASDIPVILTGRSATDTADVSGGVTTFNVEDGQTHTIAGVISGVGALTKTGSGTMTLSGTNTYTGGTKVSAGELVFAGSSLPVGTHTAAGGTLVLGTAGNTITATPVTSILADGGTVRVDGDLVLTERNSYVICGGSWTGNGTVTIDGGYMRVNTFDFTNGITFNGGLILNNTTDNILNADVTVVKDGSTIQAGWSKMLTFNGALKGSASLTVGKDSGWVRFSGDASEYTGDLLINGNMRAGADGKDTSDASQFLGSGVLQFNGGTLQNNNNHITIPNTLEVLSDSSLKAGWSKNITCTGAITGSGKLSAISDSGWVIMGTTSDDTFTGDVQCSWNSTSSMGKMRLAAEQPFGANAGTGYFYGQLDMNGYSQAFKGLYSNTDDSTLKGQIFNNTDKRSTLTLNITGKDLTYQGKIDGNIELIVNADGEGKQTLNNNASTFTGNIVINGGTLVTTKSYTGTASALGATSTEGGRTITVNAGAELSFGVNDTLGGCDSTNSYDDNRATLIINGGKLSGTGNNALYNATFQNGAELYSNDCRDVWRSFWFKGTTNVSFAGDGSAAEKPVNFNGVPEAIVVPDNAVFNVDDITKNTASDLIVNVTMGNKSSGLITTNSLTKTGAGTMELTSANSYDSGTTVSGGTLKLSGAGTLGTGAVAVNEDGTLEIAYDDPAQTLNIPSLTMAEGSVLKLTSGTASIDEALTAEAGAQLVFELGGTTDSSIFLGSGSTLDISDDAVLELLLRDGVSGTYTLIEAENGFGDYADASFWTDLLTAESDYFWNLSIVGNSLLATADPNVVPEPATWALLILGAFGIYCVRRKK